jgi:hypothetical protein
MIAHSLHSKVKFILANSRIKLPPSKNQQRSWKTVTHRWIAMANMRNIIPGIQILLTVIIVQILAITRHNHQWVSIRIRYSLRGTEVFSAQLQDFCFGQEWWGLLMML